MSERIRIIYGGEEEGFAELLGDRLARIYDQPLTDRVSRHDIVCLSHLPGEAAGFPTIAKIVYQRHPCRTYLRFAKDEELSALIPHLRLADSFLVTIAGPQEAELGIAIVAHPEKVDPQLLAKAIGLNLPATSMEVDSGSDTIPPPNNANMEGGSTE